MRHGILPSEIFTFWSRKFSTLLGGGVCSPQRNHAGLLAPHTERQTYLCYLEETIGQGHSVLYSVYHRCHKTTIMVGADVMYRRHFTSTGTSHDLHDMHFELGRLERNRWYIQSSASIAVVSLSFFPIVFISKRLLLQILDVRSGLRLL